MTKTVNSLRPARRRLRRAAAGALVLALVGAGCGSDSETATEGEGSPATEAGGEATDAPEAQGETYELRVASFIPDGDNVHVQILKEWMSRIEDGSDGRITFEPYWSGSLCDAQEITRCVSEGKADVGQTVPGYNPELFPAHEMISVPFVSSQPQAVIDAYAQLYDTSDQLREESAGQGLEKMLIWPALKLLVGARQAVEAPQELEGVNIRAIGPVRAFEMLGANPVSLTAGDIYQAMQTGTVDAIGGNYDGILAYNYHEVAPYWYDTGAGHYATLAVWMNEDTYGSLPEDLQSVVDDANQAMVDGALIETFNDALEPICDELIASGEMETMAAWDEADVEAWKAEVQDAVLDDWVRQAEQQGVSDPRSVFEEYSSLVAEAEEAAGSNESALATCIERFAENP